ncbi:hypothetical protein C8R43DRAFT_1130591 [Mycena crocata]|nr:hypothetical protein C8R43DRAFT_1130591 [Mycena crocata]
MEKGTLENAVSALELLVAVRDIVAAVEYLLMEHGIRHKHISYNNVRIQGNANDRVKGLLVDLDFPDESHGSSEGKKGFTHCTSSAFQSARLLQGSSETTRMYSFRDDLESIFYVLCWACYGYDHTGSLDKFRPDWMETWRRTSTTRVVAEKLTLLSQPIKTHVNRYSGCHRDIVEGVIEKFRVKLSSLEGYWADDFSAILKIFDGGIADVKKESCGIGLECSKFASSDGGTAMKRKWCQVGPEDPSDVGISCKKSKGLVIVSESV